MSRRVWEVNASKHSLGPSVYDEREHAFRDLEVRSENWPTAILTLRSYVVSDE